MSDTHAQQDSLRRTLGLNRRQFMAATTGVAAATALPLALPGTAQAEEVPVADPTAAALPDDRSALVPASQRGIILYTVRDAISRDPNASPHPSGFKEVFAALAAIGYKQIEFAGYTQHANSEGGNNLESVAGATLLRSWLDANGLRAQGNHGFIPGSWPLSTADLDRWKRTLEIANILGMQHVGTGSDPTGSNYKADWDVAIAKWHALGELATAAGLKLYTHNHDAAYNFLLDSGPLDALGRPTRSSGIRKLEYFLSQTDKHLVFLEMDLFWAHVAQYKFSNYTAADGTVVQDIFDPFTLIRDNQKRYPLFHIKDGKVNPAIPNGYDMVPLGTGNINYREFFERVKIRDKHHPMYEQDNAPNGADPAQSLGLAQLSWNNWADMREDRYYE
ncbi:sugar phosphate isomerase/epimerase family protein [Herbidospora cretacea]|uniref:sugar phosphate isomerase/epimerase family protein n=1 Tax=Herbidospora cretacea TaxID=28444 RepID=UPI0004C3B766|nr:TIM barrel protein [Herbidospora cretacea]